MTLSNYTSYSYQHRVLRKQPHKMVVASSSGAVGCSAGQQESKSVDASGQMLMCNMKIRTFVPC